MPKISILVPIYNVEEYLEKCLDSILNQTFTDFELIGMDDGSTDLSGVILDRYAQRDHRVRATSSVVMHRAFPMISLCIPSQYQPR